MSRIAVPTTVGSYTAGTVTAARPIIQTAKATATASVIQTSVPGTAKRPATTTMASAQILKTQAATGTMVSGTVTQAPRIASGAIGSPVTSGITVGSGSVRQARVISSGSLQQAATPTYVSSGMTARAPQVIPGAPIVRQVATAYTGEFVRPINIGGPTYTQSAYVVKREADAVDLLEMNRRLGALEIERAEKVSSAFVFIKPHAVTDGVKNLVADRFASEGITVLSEGPINSEKIDKEMLIDTHYGAIASRAMKQKPAELVVSQNAKDEFEKAFGLLWSDALANGLVYNLVDGASKLGVTYSELGDRYDELKKGTTLLKFGGGFYCGKVGDIYVINGFYARMRSQFTVPGECIYYYEVQWDASRLPWGDFRGKLLGSTDPKTADECSMRNIIFRKWESLGLSSEPNTGNNGLHASASPFEALSERSNWLGVPLSQDFFGRAMLASGIPLCTIEAWCEDPAVMFDGKKQSLFDLLEDLDGRECLKKSSAIEASN